MRPTSIGEVLRVKWQKWFLCDVETKGLEADKLPPDAILQQETHQGNGKEVTAGQPTAQAILQGTRNHSVHAWA